MVMVDTSVWINHLRQGDALLAALLQQGIVAIHPFIIGEIACGNLSNREYLLGLLSALPQAPAATNEEALVLIERRQLMGRGLGFIDIHLLGTTLIHGAMSIWSTDKRLSSCAAELGIAYQPVY